MANATKGGGHIFRVKMKCSGYIQEVLPCNRDQIQLGQGITELGRLGSAWLSACVGY